jgi:hypothetical protein
LTTQQLVAVTGKWLPTALQAPSELATGTTRWERSAGELHELSGELVFASELEANGYHVLAGQTLNAFKASSGFNGQRAQTREL